jgi:hypothetical protein
MFQELLFFIFRHLSFKSVGKRDLSKIPFPCSHMRFHGIPLVWPIANFSIPSCVKKNCPQNEPMIHEHATKMVTNKNMQKEKKLSLH